MCPGIDDRLHAEALVVMHLLALQAFVLTSTDEICSHGSTTDRLRCVCVCICFSLRTPLIVYVDVRVFV